jgi:Glycosyl hydrolases family 18
MMAAVALLLLAACGGQGTQSNGHNSPGSNTSSSPASTGSASPGHKYISFTSYPGWIQTSIPPGKFNFAPWTIVNDFGLWPTPTGGIAVGDMGSLSYIPPAVAAAHRAGRMIIMAVGEQGVGAKFVGAASPKYQARFITNITNYVAKYHFDGVDVDWEEGVPQNAANYVSLIKNLRGALDRGFPRHMFLSADVNTGQIPPYIAAQIAPYVDTLNLETFQNNGISSVAAYAGAGIPASKMLLGIGVANGYYDINQARVAAKVNYVETHGLAGTLLWQPGNLRTQETDPRLTPLLHMVGTSG